uniref:Gustatory receptor 6 n=1 Tax=Sclerodermus sp. MQW-2015 TaxID=1729718 RepID=A0A0N9JZF1_9HYME|nr:gustatory receptor 6 [Sclerodermus sp. MQW-2015]
MSGVLTVANFKGTISTLSLCLWICLIFLKLFITNRMCAAVSNEAALTKQILQEIKPSYLKGDLREEVQQFALQLELNPLRFHAAGFFVLDNGFTKRFFGTVATYLVIFIQMSSSSNVYDEI